MKVPAVVPVIGTGQRCFGTGRQPRAKRRQFYARRTALQQAKKVRAVHKRQGTEQRWMRDINHTLSHQIVSHARQQGVGMSRMEQLAGIRTRTRQRTARTSRGATGRSRTAANARTTTRLIATWAFQQLAPFIAYNAERAGIAVEWVDPAQTSQQCPARLRLNTADDRHYVCAECGWTGHRDAVGAINSSRGRTPGTGRHGESAGATLAAGSDGGRAA